LKYSFIIVFVRLNNFNVLEECIDGQEEEQEGQAKLGSRIWFSSGGSLVFFHNKVSRSVKSILHGGGSSIHINLRSNLSGNGDGVADATLISVDFSNSLHIDRTSGSTSYFQDENSNDLSVQRSTISGGCSGAVSHHKSPYLSLSGRNWSIASGSCEEAILAVLVVIGITQHVGCIFARGALRAALTLSLDPLNLGAAGFGTQNSIAEVNRCALGAARKI